jgi:hypothetical protein
MNSKKFQHIFFVSLFILSISSSLYLNFHVELVDNPSPLVELTESSNESSGKLMADIDAFKNLIRNVAKQVVFN